MKLPTYTLTNAVFNPDTGVSIVFIEDDITHLQYYGKAFVHPKDKSCQSKFFGCELAQDRAAIQMYQYYIDNIKMSKLSRKRFVEAIQNIQQNINTKIIERDTVLNHIKIH